MDERIVKEEFTKFTQEFYRNEIWQTGFKYFPGNFLSGRQRTIREFLFDSGATLQIKKPQLMGVAENDRLHLNLHKHSGQTLVWGWSKDGYVE